MRRVVLDPILRNNIVIRREEFWETTQVPKAFHNGKPVYWERERQCVLYWESILISTTIAELRRRIHKKLEDSWHRQGI